MPRKHCSVPLLFVLASPRTSYYTQFQHSHYPQASYGHYQPYIPPTQAAQAQTPAPVTAAVQRQPSQAANQLDTADVATLNDALGSAGVDLRVCAPISILAHTLNSAISPRRKKKPYSAVPTNTRHIVHMRTARENSPQILTLTRASWVLQCARLGRSTKF
jgi:hypothetical protein